MFDQLPNLGEEREIRHRDLGTEDPLMRTETRGILMSGRAGQAREIIPRELADYAGLAWNGGRALGMGGEGFVHLFVLLDENEVIVDRIVVKTAYMSSLQWLFAPVWFGDVYDLDGGIPNDVKALEQLRSSARTDNIIFCEKTTMDAEKRMYRLFLEYCPHADLSEEKYFSPPEPFVWYVLESLVNAAVAMERLVWDQNSNENRMIVHRDIKPGNIFLADESATTYSLYPQPKLADFGMCIFTSENDPFNPRAYTEQGTNRFLAPEQLDWLGSWTNVWAIRKTVRELMIQRRIGVEQWEEYKHERNAEAGFDEGFRRAVKDQDLYFPDRALRYSNDLRDIVSSCLAFDPQERPSLQKLLDDIRDNTGLSTTGQPDLADGMRNPGNDADRRARYGLKLDDVYWKLTEKMDDRAANPGVPLRIPKFPDSSDDKSSDDEDEDEDEED